MNAAACNSVETGWNVRTSRELAEAALLGGFLNDALEVARAEGLSDGVVLPVWPADLQDMGAPLTVGALRRLADAIAKATAK